MGNFGLKQRACKIVFSRYSEREIVKQYKMAGRLCLGCPCQWGVSLALLGVIIILAAGVFSFFPFVIGWFKWQWYIFLCYAWFFLGVFLAVVGFVRIAILGCDENKVVEAREPFL